MQTDNSIEHQDRNGSAFRGTFVFWLFIFLLLIGLDQTIKYFVFHGRLQNALNFLNPVFQEVLFKNYNFAFSLPVPHVLMFAVYAVVLVFAGVYFARHCKAMGPVAVLAWVLIFAGAYSNVGERMVFGYVRDFVLFLNGIFNIADVYILLGVAILLFQPLTRNFHDS